MSAEMTEGRLRWVIAGFAFFVGVAYFVWLSAVYIKFMETNRAIREMASEFYSGPVPCPPETVDSTVVDPEPEAPITPEDESG